MWRNRCRPRHLSLETWTARAGAVPPEPGSHPLLPREGLPMPRSRPLKVDRTARRKDLTEFRVSGGGPPLSFGLRFRCYRPISYFLKPNPLPHPVANRWPSNALICSTPFPSTDITPPTHPPCRTALPSSSSGCFFLFSPGSVDRLHDFVASMRMSCNGCRVLRKGCSDNCSIRPCLQWIKNPESQANATVFLAKFYGRAGLMNLIDAGPEHLRPAIFRSLLYEACGRIVNPIYGSVGLLWAGSWQMCQAAVEAVLKGSPIVQVSTESAAKTPSPPLKTYDIRHVSKDEPTTETDNDAAVAARASSELRKVAKATRTRFKRSVPRRENGGSSCLKPTAWKNDGDGPAEEARLQPMDTHGGNMDQFRDLQWRRCRPEEAPSQDSSASSHEEAVSSRENAASSSFSEETADASMVTGEKEKCLEVELELTLGLERVSHASSGRRSSTPPKPQQWPDSDQRGFDLVLDLAT